MRSFLLGVIVTILVCLIGVAGVVLLGLAPTHADVAPPTWERHIAMTALDHAVERNAPRVNNPIPPTVVYLMVGM